MGWCVGSLEAVWNRGGRRVKTDGMVCWKSGSCLEQGREGEKTDGMVCWKSGSCLEQVREEGKD